MNTKIITKSEVSSVIANIPKGAFFTVDFIKKDGSFRKMNCRTGVVKYLTPNPTRNKAEMPKNIVTVFDVQSSVYRHINIDTTLKIVAEKTIYEVK